MENAKMSSPWISYIHMIEALFGKDPDIRIEYTNDYSSESPSRKMYVNSDDKARALRELIPRLMCFGNVTLYVWIGHDARNMSSAEIIRNALKGNPLFDEVMEIQPEGSSNTFTYAMFAPEVVQFWDDNLGDPHGNVSALAQDVARKLFKELPGVYYCTSVEPFK